METDIFAASILTIAPTRRELGGLGDGNEHTRASIVDIGRSAGEQVASLLDAAPRRLLVSLGYAGALDPHLHTGDLVVGSAYLHGLYPAVQGAPQATRAAMLLRQSGLSVLEGAVPTVDELLLTPRAKRRARYGSRALVEDMEGHWIADAAASRDISFIGIRAVLDAADFHLHSFIATIIADKGQREWAHAVRAMAHPSVVGSFLPLALKSRGASRALRMAAQSIRSGSGTSTVSRILVTSVEAAPGCEIGSDREVNERSMQERLHRAVAQTHLYFFHTQRRDGYWWGELESNPTMEAEYIMLTHFMGSDEGDRIPRIAEDIRRRQSPDGSWRTYYGAPGDLSTSIECYFALKLAGDPPEAPHMTKARDFILRRGGVPKARVFTKIWLALFGQWDWKGTPAMPPDMMLLPKWAPFNIYRFASWARATIVPMTIILTLHPTRPPRESAWIMELYPEGPVTFTLSRRKAKPFSLKGGFLVLDKATRIYRKLPFMPGRERAIKAATDWIVSHQEADGSWAGIQPPWVYSLIALSALGFPLDHPVIAKGLEGFRRNWSVPSEDGNALRVQACLSPVWDTCLALRGLLDSGVPSDHPAIQRAASWLIREEIRVKGDWAVFKPNLKPSGWAFEFDNVHYPDIDDSAVIVADLASVRMDDAAQEPARTAAIDRAVAWLTGMQCSNGGWAAFDWNNDSSQLAKIPFADFGELLDPPSADVTAHVLEMYGKLGYSVQHPAVSRGLSFIWDQQERDGPWFGRWGVNYIYGTAAVLPALESLDVDMTQPRVRRAVEWLLLHQNPDGGWGESCLSYADPTLRGQGESTSSQTSWALIALIAAGEAQHESVKRGVEFLLERQHEDGTWDEPQFTGCGFPGYGPGDRPNRYDPLDGPDSQGPELSAAFMINYHLYRNYFPLWALGRYARALKIALKADSYTRAHSVTCCARPDSPTPTSATVSLSRSDSAPQPPPLSP